MPLTGPRATAGLGDLELHLVAAPVDLDGDLTSSPARRPSRPGSPASSEAAATGSRSTTGRGACSTQTVECFAAMKSGCDEDRDVRRDRRRDSGDLGLGERPQHPAASALSRSGAQTTSFATRLS